MAPTRPIGNRPTLGGLIMQHIFVFLICIVFPGAVTAICPAAWLTMERTSDGVRGKVRTCLFFVIPYKFQQVDYITEIGQRERAGRTEKQREFGRTTDKTVHVQGEGFLQIHGPGDQLLEVSVSPASLDRVAGRANDFLNGTEPGPVTIFVIANWKFGALMGGVLSLLTLLYIVGYSMEFIMFLAKQFWRALPAATLRQED